LVDPNHIRSRCSNSDLVINETKLESIDDRGPSVEPLQHSIVDDRGSIE